MRAAMRAVWYDRQGAADEVLVCRELPTPEAGHGEVRVRLEASGVNPSDTYRRRGPPAMEYPRVVTNSDRAGVVDPIGPGGPPHWVGKRVWLYNGQRNAAGWEPRQSILRYRPIWSPSCPITCPLPRGRHLECRP